jgi:hypothetical protein
VNGRFIWLTLVALFGSLGADDKDLSGGVDYVGGDGLQLIGAQARAIWVSGLFYKDRCCSLC